MIGRITNKWIDTPAGKSLPVRPPAVVATLRAIRPPAAASPARLPASRSMARLLAVLLPLLLWTASCTKEPGLAGEGEDSPVRINLSTRAIMGETINGVKISSLRLIAAQSDKIIFNRTVADGGLSENGTGNLEFDIAVGTYDFYAVINESQDLSRVTSMFDLKRIQVPRAIAIVDAALTAENNLCMFGSRRGVVIRKRYDNQPQVSLDGGTTWQSTLPLNMARVAVKLGFLFKTATGATATIKSIKLRHVPLYSLLEPAVFDNPNFQPETTIFGGGATVPIDETVKQVVTVLIPEYLLSLTPAADGTKAVEMVVEYEVMGQAKTSTVKLYHAFDGTDKDYNLYRDNYYHLTGTFKYPDILINTVVLPWNNLPLTDNNGVVPTIKKVIEDYTPCDGAAEFTVGLSEAAQWRVVIDNPDDFTVTGTKTNTGTGDIGGVFNIRPRAFPKPGSTTSTKVYIIVNGQIVDESTVNSMGGFEYGWYLVGNGTNSLYVADRNQGASSPKRAGCLYKYGSKVGLSYSNPTFATYPSVSSPVVTYQITAWERTSDRYVASSAVTSQASSWTSIPYQSAGGTLTAENNPCPKGWRLASPTDFTSIIDARLTAESVKTYGTFAKGTLSGRILTDEKGEKQYFPIMHYREASSGILTPDGAVTAGYYWLSNGRTQVLSPTGSSASISNIVNGVCLRCVADPFGVTYEAMGVSQRSYQITVKPLFDKPWTIKITDGGEWLQLSEVSTWGSGQTTSVGGTGDKSFYLQPQRNTTPAPRTATLLVTDGEAYQTISVTQKLSTANSSTTMVFAYTNHSPGAGIATSMDNGALNTRLRYLSK